MRDCPYDVRLQRIAATPQIVGDMGTSGHGDRSNVDVSGEDHTGPANGHFLAALDPQSWPR